MEPYIHRIGRTGRAGRTGEAILFVNRNERWMLKKIEQATKQKIKEITLPSNKTINKMRVAGFKQSITQALETKNLAFFENLIEGYAREQNIPVTRVAAALAGMAHGDTPFLLSTEKEKKAPLSKKERIIPIEKGMERYRIEVGRRHGVRPRNIVGAISNEAGLDSKHIGAIDINPEFSFVDLPYGMPKNIFALLKKTWVGSRQMAISKCA